MEVLRVPPTTGKKKKARKVFGDAAADDLDSSLTYSHTSSESLTRDTHLPVLHEECDSYSSGTTLSGKENSTNNINVSGLPTITTTTRAFVEMKGIHNVTLFTHSPVRPDLVKKTQDAINKANLSMKNFSQSIVAARLAKLDFYNYQRKETSKVKQNWKEDLTEVKTLNEVTEQNRRMFLSLQRQFSSKYSKEKARREQSQRKDILNQIEKEIQFKSAVHCDHQSKQKKDEDDRRRLSVEARAKIRVNNRLGSEKVRMEKIHEEQAIIAERHAASIALRENVQQNKIHRRQSFAFRNGDARRIRQLHAKMENQRRVQEHESFNLNWKAMNDTKEYIRQEMQKRRESLANRNLIARNVRKEDGERQQHVLSKLHESYELKWAGEEDAKETIRRQEEEKRKSLQLRNLEGKRQRDYLNQQHFDKISTDHKNFELQWAAENDVTAHKRQLEEERRESLALRNKEGRRRRAFEQQELSRMARNEHDNFELKWAGERDAEAYVRQQEKLRRASLENRNKERALHAKMIEELRMLALEKESESLALKWAGENDVKEYLSKLDHERRLSLVNRGQQTLHRRKVESEQNTKKLQGTHEDEVLRATDQREIDKYRKECAERNRASFEYRRKDARIQRIEEEENSRKLRDVEYRNLALESQARIDVVEYLNDCKKRRRMSLACRAKEKRKHGEWLRQQKKAALDEHSRRIHDQRIDQKFIELAQQKERARLALNAIRHAGYTFKTNVTFISES